jgi:anaerobic magnesium-protoporphyrin IX monomethyl ester cyclase
MLQKKRVILITPLSTTMKMRGQILGMPYGPLYLSESLYRQGYEPYIVYTTNDEAIKKVIQLVTNDTLCIGISTMSGVQLFNAISIATILKKMYPHLPLVWGGVHVTALPEQTLKSELVDVIVWGEGEDVFPKVLKAIENNDLSPLIGQPGVGIKKNGQCVIGPNSGYTELEERIFELPYHLLDMPHHSRKLLIGPEREFQIWTSRGCPYRCKFCSNSSRLWPNTKMRNHSIEHIVRDVSVLHRKYGADCIMFADEGFLQSEERFINILEAIRNEGIFIKYRFAARTDILLRLKPETWEMMKEYGVIGIGTAPESGSQRILDYMGKGITLEQIYKVDAILTKYKFFKSFNFLVCTPSETIEDLKATLLLLSNLAETSKYCPYPIGTALHKYIPLPETKLFDDAIMKGFKPPEKLEEWGYFDCDAVRETRSIVRPWLLDADFDFIEKATVLIETLNHEFTGEGANISKINQLLQDIKKLIE